MGLNFIKIIVYLVSVIGWTTYGATFSESDWSMMWYWLPGMVTGVLGMIFVCFGKYGD